MSVLSWRAAARTAAILIGLFTSIPGVTRSADAAFINFEADLEHRFKGVGSLTGSIEYTFDQSVSQGWLTITLTNMMADESKSYITGFIFNLDSSDDLAISSLISSPPDFEDAANQNVPPFGHKFEFGAALSGHFMGGGDPREGIAPGETQSFAFRVTAADAAYLEPHDLIDGEFDHNFIVRFRSVGPGGNDIVPIQATIPGPSALGVFAIIIAFWRRSHRALATEPTLDWS